MNASFSKHTLPFGNFCPHFSHPVEYVMNPNFALINFSLMANDIIHASFGVIPFFSQLLLGYVHY